MKRREAKSKEQKERYKHLNGEFQRTARRDKKAFLSDQCKEIEGNNRMGKTRDLFKKVRDTKGTFHAKIGTIKDRNGMDLTEAEDILRRDVKNTQKNYIKKDLNETDNSPRTRHSGCEVKWVLGSITTNIDSGSDGISAKLFQILKDDVVKALHSISQQIWKTQQWPQD